MAISSLLSIFATVTEINRPKDTSLARVQKEIKPYIQNFVNAAIRNKIDNINDINNFTIELSPIREVNPNYIGYCLYKDKTIYLDDEFWNNADDNSRQIVVNHELGHCLLGRVHIEQEIVENNEVKPKSIMFPTIIASEVFVKNKVYFEKELFQEKNEFGQVQKALNGIRKDLALVKNGRCNEIE